MQRIIIDTDPGVDDAHAIMMALAHPQTEVAAITTVAGNVSLARASANALILLDLCERDLPVYPGCASALVARERDASSWHGEDGLGNIHHPASQRTLENEHAALAMIRLARGEPGELTMVALGPLTNLALAARLDPDFPALLRRLVVMGGAVRGFGNTSRVAVEFNFGSDPEAAAIVFQSWKQIELLTWETTVEHALTSEQVNELGSLGTARSDFYQRITSRIRQFTRNELGDESFFCADPLAMAVALDPRLIEQAAEHYVEVELGGQQTRGQSVVDWYRTAGKDPNTRLISKLDQAAVYQLLRLAVE